MNLINKTTTTIILILILISAAHSDEFLIDVTGSFRYPTKRFLNPSVSPDDKWLIYNKLETSRKELSYTRLGRHDGDAVPFYPPGSKQKMDRVGENREWSPDGSILAISGLIKDGARTILVDFSGEKPQFIESFKSKSHNGQYRWTRDGALIYLDEYANIMKKRPGKKPERVVSFRSSHSATGGTDGFDLAPNGVLIYRSGKRIYSTDLTKPGPPSLIFTGEDLYGMTISPNGGYALLFSSKEVKRNSRISIIDLESHERIDIPQKVLRAAWSPDGTKVAYAEYTSPEKDKSDPEKVVWDNPHFYIIDLTTKRTRDYNYGVSKDFSWTPDGEHIIYSTKSPHPYLKFYENGIFIIRISDGNEIGRVNKINANSPPVISPSGKYIIWKGFNMDTFFVSSNPLPSEMFANKK